MPSLVILPSEVVPRFGAGLPPLIGTSVREWREYRSATPRLRLLAPLVNLPRAPEPKAQPAKNPGPAPERVCMFPPEPDPHLLSRDERVAVLKRPPFVNDMPSVGYLISVCAAFYGIRRAELEGPSRRAIFALPRQVAMFLAKTLTTASLPQIGLRIGGRDHTTILHGFRKIEAAIETNGKLRADVEVIKNIVMAPRQESREAM